MIAEIPLPAVAINEEIPALIETLLATEQRLEELTAGQVDAVAGRDGRTFLLRRAQEQLRHSEAGKQAGILNALPAHIALLDTQGTIVSVNESWRRFAEANVRHAPGHGVGLNYLAICDRARGDYSFEAHRVATGIRGVLDGERKSFSIEYPCHSPTEQRWFLLTVTPLSEAQPNGVVVMHVNISERKLAETALQGSQETIQLTLKAACLGHWALDLVTNQASRSLLHDQIFGYEELQADWSWERFLTHVIPEDRAEVDLLFRAAVAAKTGWNIECRIVRRDGVLSWIWAHGKVFINTAGDAVRMLGIVSDITERKRAEERFRLSEERLRAALSASRTGTFRWEFRTNELSWDESLDALFGIPQGQAIRSLETFIATVHPDDRPNVIERCERCAREGADFDAEFRVLWPDGSLHWVDDKGKTFFDAAGHPLYMTGACVDITAHKLAETALRESEAEFRSLAEAMPQMVWITQPNGWNIYFSQQWMDYTGLTLEESLGHGWYKPFHPEDQQPAWDAWQLATSTIGVYSIECRLRRADGAYRWWLIRGVPQQDASGNILKWFGTCTDIHEMKLAELEISRANQALSASDEKFRQLADNITDVFWIMSPNFKIIEYVSAGYELIFGHSAESLYSHPHQWAEAILPEERENVFAVLSTLMGTAPEVSVEYRIARPDGTVRWIRDRGFQIRDAAGKLVRLTGIASDITEQKQLEAQLRQAQKMEAIGTLAGGIAHDFNNILAAIMGYSEMAQRGISPDIRPYAHLQEVLRASNRAKDLVRQILTFSRQENPEREALELQHLINETLMLVRVSLPSTVEIHQNIDTTAPSVLGDATQIQQAIMNLFVNAGQAMKERGGVLDVRLTRIDIDHEYATAHPELNEGPHVCLAVSDTGGGMDHATQGRIFEPFFTTKAPGEGTGLGLAVVHGVIKNHGGVIVVSSEPGVGTTFSIYLPVYDRRRSAFIQKSDPVPRGNGEHILFVDDEEALVSLGKSMLEDLGYRVTTRTNSIEALEVFTSQPEDFDLVITDQTMPHLSGADLATALLETRPALPVILVTGYSSEINREKAKAIGIAELLSKPNTMQSLGETIRRVLGQRKE